MAGGIHSEIVSYAPHSSRTEPHVESFLPGVNIFWVILPGSMIQHFDLRWLSFGSLEVVYLCLISVPNQAVLDSHDSLDSCIGHGLLEILIDTLPLLRALHHLVGWNEIVSFRNLVGLLPVLRESLALYVFKEPFFYFCLGLQMLETDQLQSGLATIWGQNLNVY